MGDKLLIIDDDEILGELLTTKLTSLGFEIYCAHSGGEGLRKLYQYQPDLIILDVMMPDMDGFETCQRIRELCDAPVIFLSAKTEENDVVRAFQVGGDDFMRKPFSIHELQGRIRARLRRGNSHRAAGDFYDDGKLRINLTKQQVYLNGKRVHLTPTEFKLLRVLVENPQKVLSHNELLRQVWGPYYKDAEACVSIYIHYLRDKLEEVPREPRYIRTKWGVGYWFESHE